MVRDRILNFALILQVASALFTDVGALTSVDVHVHGDIQAVSDPMEGRHADNTPALIRNGNMEANLDKEGGVELREVNAQHDTQEHAKHSVIRRAKHDQPIPATVEAQADTESQPTSDAISTVHLAPVKAPDAALAALAALRRAGSILSDVSTSTLIVAVVVSFIIGVSLTALFLMWPRETLHLLDNATDEATDIVAISANVARSQTKALLSVFSSENLKPVVETPDHDFMVIEEGANVPKRYWKWLTREEAEIVGVQLQAPTPSYRGLERVDVDANPQAVDSLISNARNVQVGELKRTEGFQQVLWKLLRNQLYFMASSDASSVVLMIETVRLRIVVGNHVLMQEADDSLLHGKIGLPGMEKKSSEAPRAAAQHLWENVFKMPTDKADFVPDRIEDVEFQGYAGLECVERAHIYVVRVKTEDPELLSRIGLPDYKKFTCALQRRQSDMFGQDARNLSFRWATFEDFLKLGGSLSKTDVGDKGVMSFCDSPSELVEFLRKGGVDTDTWVRDGDDRTLQLLLKELAKGKCYLEQSGSGLLRVLDIVMIRLWSPDRRLILVDRGRQNQWGEETWDAQLPGRKKDKAESFQQVTISMAKIVGLDEQDLSICDELNWEYFSDVSTSSRFTGLSTKYQKFFVDAVLEDDPELLRRMGLIDDDDDDCSP